ncbi:metallophosphoesterase [Thermogladius sp. KZ2Tp1]|uniref:metallophosphoesterase family protein n=1 Tax=Thermogladius sp. KZ2Tp1 TaxID=3136289 RepID=UPI003DAA3C6D
MVLILATGDIHAPVYTSSFLGVLEKAGSIEPDVVLLAGDLVEHNNIAAFRPVYEELLKRFGRVPIVAVFGNEEYAGFEDEYRRVYGRVRWLNDEVLDLEVSGARLCIIGSRGALNRPTKWQERHMPGLRVYYKTLPEKVLRMSRECRARGCQKIVLLTHYGVTFKNLAGEPRDIWDYLANPDFERVLAEGGFSLAIHAHAHRGVYERVVVGGTPVYNVSFPARGRIVEVSLE